ncbi:hypothetical protein [Psychromonas arctica]|uniref:hypothetical protein n=1 Tax=Psychromonas arctica TaxID=168275 RepID=UPI002FD317BC
MENLITLKVRAAEGMCRVCGTIREVYYLNDSSYGERLLLTSDGKYYAYVNLFKDEVYDEVELIIKDIFCVKGKKLSLKESADYLNLTFGVACDDINYQVIDASKNIKSCLNCGSKDLDFEISNNEYVKQVEVPLITHFKWKELEKEEKKKLIAKKLNL